MQQNINLCEKLIKNFYIPKMHDDIKLVKYQKKICAQKCKDKKSCEQWISFLKSIQVNIKIKEKYMKLK